MKEKPFTHHDGWFVVYPAKDPVWPFNRYVVHVPDKLLNHEWFYHFIEPENQMYRISREMTEKFRRRYNGRWHISKEFLELWQYPSEWQHWIDEYRVERKKMLDTKWNPL
jgi:hypothetical protein